MSKDFNSAWLNEREAKLSKPKICNDCHGSGKVGYCSENKVGTEDCPTCGGINICDQFEGKESVLHDQIIAECQRRRWWFAHSRMDKKTTQSKGIPDFIIAASSTSIKAFADYYNKPMNTPLTYYIEVKRKGAKLTKEQNITRHVLLALGHKWACVYSYPEFLAVIDG